MLFIYRFSSHHADRSEADTRKQLGRTQLSEVQQELGAHVSLQESPVTLVGDLNECEREGGLPEDLVLAVHLAAHPVPEQSPADMSVCYEPLAVTCGTDARRTIGPSDFDHFQFQFHFPEKRFLSVLSIVACLCVC